MKQKKILVISPVPSHPINQGNRRRICNMLFDLRKLGFHITYAYFNQPLIDANPYDTTAMKQCWDKFYLVPLSPKSIFRNKSKEILVQVGNAVEKRSSRLYYFIKEKFFKKPDFIALDKLHDPALDNFVKDLLKKEKFDAVLLNYIFNSKVFKYFDSKTLKVIDTFDVFTDKHKLFLEKAKEYGGASTTSEEEAKALDRADIIIAIQDKEKEFFSKITSKIIVTIGHLVPRVEKQKTVDRKNILFVGATHPPNMHGINFFIKEVLPKVKKKFPDSRLLIAGGISGYIHSNEVTKLGELEDIGMAYGLADIVISPIFFGTGLKIKNIEALSYCKPLVTTSCCAKELGKGARKCVLVADNAEEFVKQLSKVFLSKKLAENMSRNAYSFMKKYNQKNLDTLNEIFNIK